MPSVAEASLLRKQLKRLNYCHTRDASATLGMTFLLSLILVTK